MYFQTTHYSPVGTITLACDGSAEHLVGLWTEGQKYHGDTLPEVPESRDSLAIFDRARDWLDRYFAGKQPAIDELTLAPIGGEFRQGVWAILREIPYGQVITYGEIAKQMATRAGKERMSSQAVGGAVGHNPISIIIPCHRVVGANGSLTGYSGGVAMKTLLLELEGVDMSRLFVPTKGTAL
ncbi:MAG: methylated-DNA--[protein]-cysteine S-methyltransferase [Ancrocorticia populi]|uniref:Methylated-DNA--protein-cysteine methyltransferase n=1 Tax=Ancrocorticia populi TaxID=2175228 RepID=A0A2V1KAY0_9ACTO|nr:methylated-DNA--[protein]-cysteine S-methyltransferase [Ancrocorticia populi]PWF26515.1 cysteine methyltransferase [Ancrocorticia populi]